MIGYCIKQDVSLEPKDYYDLVVQTRKVIQDASTLSSEEKESLVTVGYGHLGDGDIHVNVSLPNYDDPDLQRRVNDLVDPFVNEYVRAKRGSISAEHGIGQQKSRYLGYSKSEQMISLMK